MYKEYAELYQTYTQQYGKKTAIFLMVGSFYELYDIQNTETGETLDISPLRLPFIKFAGEISLLSMLLHRDFPLLLFFNSFKIS